MGLIDYIPLQPNQRAIFTNTFDEEYAVATITLIRSAIEKIYKNSTPQNCQSTHFNSVNHTNSTRTSIAQ